MAPPAALQSKRFQAPGWTSSTRWTMVAGPPAMIMVTTGTASRARNIRVPCTKSVKLAPRNPPISV